VFRALLTYAGLVNQGFGKVNAAAGLATVLLSGMLPMDVHGFGLVTLVQSIWLIWIGGLLCREGGARPSP
jgi:hypothetical protein